MMFSERAGVVEDIFKASKILCLILWFLEKAEQIFQSSVVITLFYTRLLVLAPSLIILQIL